MGAENIMNLLKVILSEAHILHVHWHQWTKKETWTSNVYILHTYNKFYYSVEPKPRISQAKYRQNMLVIDTISSLDVRI